MNGRVGRHPVITLEMRTTCMAENSDDAGIELTSARGATQRPSKAAYRFALGTTLVTVATLFPLIWIARVPFAVMPGIAPFFIAILIITEITSSFLLFVWFAETPKPSLLLLGCTYLHASVIALLYLLSFPGVLRPDAVAFGTTQTSAWLLLIWWSSYSVLGLAATVIECLDHKRLFPPDRVVPLVTLGLALTATSVATIAALTFVHIDRLPTLLGTGQAFSPVVFHLRIISIALMLAAALLGFGIAGRRHPVFLWFAVAMAAMLCVNILLLVSGGRETLGWTVGRVAWAIAASVLFLFFIGQFAQQMRELSRARAELERRVNERTTDLVKSLHQRDLLLREVYHRVKNNVQVIDSMLFLERRKITDPAARAGIDTIRDRIYALGLVHQQLMSSDDLGTVDMSSFLRALVANIGRAQGVRDRKIALDVSTERIRVSLDIALPVGLLVTELVTNSIKHASPRTISVAFRLQDPNTASLQVNDDSDRQPASSAPLKQAGQTETSGLGSSIVAGLAHQLGAEVAVTERNGRHVEVVFPLSKVA